MNHTRSAILFQLPLLGVFVKKLVIGKVPELLIAAITILTLRAHACNEEVVASMWDISTQPNIIIISVNVGEAFI